MEISSLRSSMRRLITVVLPLLLLLNVLYVFSGVLNYPFRSMDVMSDWLLKAKVLYMSPTFPFVFFQDWSYMASHMQYPILLPLLFSFIYRIVGSVSEISVLLFYPVIYAATLALCYYTLRLLQINTTQSLLCTYVYSMMSPLLAQGGRGHAGNADIVITLIGWAVLSLLLQHRRRFLHILLSSLLIGIASQIKLEGVFLISILFFTEIPKTVKVIALCVSALPAVLWMNFVQIHGFASDIGYRLVSIREVFTRLAIILTGMIREMANPRNWYVFWPLFLLLLFVRERVHPFIKRTVLPAMLSMIMAYIAAYLFAYFTKTEINITKYVTSSMDRILLQLSPFYFIYFASKLSSMFSSFFSWPSQRKSYK